MKTKKILAVVLSVIMLLSSAPLGGLIGLDLPDVFKTEASAAENIGLYYSILNDEVMITDFDGSTSDELVIPDRIDGYPVTSIGGYAFYNCTSVTSIIIPDTVTEIRNYAFYYCKNLASIEIPDSVINIGAFAFDGSAYYNDSSNWEDDVLYICNHLISAKKSISGVYRIHSGVTNIADYAFNGCTGVTSIEIPNSVTTIGGGAFNNCTSLESVEIPNSVTTISGREFYGCTNLKNVIIPNSVTTIGGYAFEACANLTSVEIPESVTIIGGHAFFNCSRLESIKIPDSLTSIGSNAFYGTKYYNNLLNWKNNALYMSNYLIQVKETISGVYSIQSETKIIGDSAFCNCTKLTGIQIPESVTSIGCDAFYGCTGLTSIEIPGNVTNICYHAFCECKNLKNIKICNGVSRIGELAFFGCEKLESIKIPDSVTSIEYSAFEDCTYLDSIELPDRVIDIGRSAFYRTGYYNDDSNWDDDVLYISNHLITAFDSSSETVTIKEGTKYIENYSFESCFNPTSIVIPDSVVSIGDGAFSGCYWLTSIIIPTGVTKIGEKAIGYYSDMDNCKKIDNFVIYGHKNSAAEEYAVKNEFKFVGIHNFGDWTVVNPATCLEAGTEERICSDCNEKEIREISKLDHSYTGEVKANNDGTHSFKCVNGCDDYSGTVDCSGGTPTCTAKAVCSVCYAEYGKANGHCFTNYVSDNNANCLADGTKTAKCNNCTATDTVTDTGSKKDHSYTGEVRANNDGTHSFKCMNGCNKFGGTVNCEYTSKVKAPATCIVKGTTTYTCSVCNYSYDAQDIDLIDHKYILKNAKSATETETGYTGDTVCEYCGDVLNEGSKIPAGSTLMPGDIPDFDTFEHRNNGNNFDYWFENETFVNGTEIIIADVESGTDFDACAKQNVNNKFKMYDLKAQCGEISVQPNGDVWVAINLPGNFNPDKSIVYYVNGDTYEKMPCFVKDGKIYFKTNHFSSYAIVEESVSQGADDKPEHCSHLCHKSGFVGFIWKIINLFNRLFKINQYCECGAKHW